MSALPPIRLFRQDAELGVLSPEDVRALLQVGFLKQTDEFSLGDSPERKPLSEFPGATEETGWLTRAAVLARAAKETMTQAADAVSKKVQSFAQSGQAVTANAVDKMLEGFLPQIRALVQKVVQSAPMVAARTKLRDDEFMTKVFGATYDCLPKPVQRFVSEPQFLEFCRKHRARLLSD